ncbi:MAG: MATE family efflux transporter [Spirochaetales bacterium]|nr:MATE family efflux transporter [Spirochaetales bacterium]
MEKNLIKSTFSDKVFLKNLFSLALPIAFQSLMLSLVGASDTIMLGSLDQSSMAAVSLATQLQFIQNLTIAGIVAAFHVLGAQYSGKEDRKSVNMVLCMTVRICLIVSIITFIICFVFSRGAMRIFTNVEELLNIGVEYLKIASFSYLISGLSQCFLAQIKLGKKTSKVATISSIAVVLNIALNAIFIFGLLGSPKMGVKGAALATVISRVVELVLSIVECWRDERIRPDLSKLFAYDKVLSRDYTRQLLPLLGAYLIWTVGISSYSAFLGHMGVDASAANSLALTVRNLVQSFTKGLAGGASIMIGYELGSGHTERARIYGDRLSILSLVCGVLTALLVIAAIPLALKAVDLSETATSYFISMSFILALYVIGASYNSVVINGMFASGGDTLFDCYSIIVTMWGVAIPLAFLGTFAFNWPVAAVFICTCLDEVGKIPWTLHHYRKYKWVKDLTINN